MTPKKALERIKQLDDDKWQANAAASRLHSTAIGQIQQACTHKWKQKGMQNGGYSTTVWYECVGCGLTADKHPTPKGAKKK